jgi:hypothetical protein
MDGALPLCTPRAFILWNLGIDVTFFCINQDDSVCLNFRKFLKSRVAEQ